MWLHVIIKNKMKTYADNLPEETQDQVRLALSQIMGIDVDDVAADRLCRVESKSQVLVFGVESQVLHVDSTVIDGVGARVIDNFTNLNKIVITFSYSNKKNGRRRTYQRRIPSSTLSNKPLPSLSMGRRCFKWASLPKLLLIQPEKASCSSIRTEWVVPSEEAADIPPIVSKFSRLVTTCLKVAATSFDFKPAHS